MRTSSQIRAAFVRGELTPDEADRLLFEWDEERVEAEARELVAENKEPVYPFPAALWHRYWTLRFERLRPVLFRLIEKYHKVMADHAPWEHVATDEFLTPSIMLETLRRLGFPAAGVTYSRKDGFVVQIPSLPLHRIGISVRQVSE